MKWQYRLAIAVPVAILSLWLAAPAPIFACTPPPGGHPTFSVAERVLAADVVVQGVVTAVTSGLPFEQATVRVEKYYRPVNAPADLPKTVTIDGFGSGALCLTMVGVGDHLIFYATGDPNTGLNAQYLTAFVATDPVTPEVIAQIQETLALLAPTPTPTATPCASAGCRRPVSIPEPATILFFGAGVAALAGYAGLKRKAR